MKNSKIWLTLFLILLAVNILCITWYFHSSQNAALASKSVQIQSLKKSLIDTRSKYLENLKAYKFVLETMLQNPKEFKQFMTEYRDIDDQVFEEKLRQKVVRLDMLIDELEEKKQ